MKKYQEQYISEVNYWLKLILWILIMLPVIFYNFTHDKTDENFYINLGKESAIPLLQGIVGYMCAQQCIKWAVKIKRSINGAYSIGFLFGPFGLLGYWFYYKNMHKIVGYTILIATSLILLITLIPLSIFYIFETNSINQSEQSFKKSPNLSILQKPPKLYADYQLENDMSNTPPKWFKDKCFQFCFNKSSEGAWVEQSYSYDLYKEKYECACHKLLNFSDSSRNILLGNFSSEFKKENWFKWKCYNKTDSMEFEWCLCSKEEDQQTHDACLYNTAEKWRNKGICNIIIREIVRNNCFALFK